MIKIRNPVLGTKIPTKTIGLTLHITQNRRSQRRIPTQISDLLQHSPIIWKQKTKPITPKQKLQSLNADIQDKNKKTEGTYLWKRQGRSKWNDGLGGHTCVLHRKKGKKREGSGGDRREKIWRGIWIEIERCRERERERWRGKTERNRGALIWRGEV